MEFVFVGTIPCQQIVPDESHLGPSTNVGFYYLGQTGRTTVKHVHETRRRRSRYSSINNFLDFQFF